MPDFSKQELQTLCNGLDALIRNEGRAIADAGIVGVRQSIGQLNLRFVTALSAFDKAQLILSLPDAIETSQALSEPTETNAVEPPASAEQKPKRATNNAAH